MASQMIECYQSRCHFAEPQKRWDQNRPLVVLDNTPYQNILNWFRYLLNEREIKRKGTDETPTAKETSINEKTTDHSSNLML